MDERREPAVGECAAAPGECTLVSGRYPVELCRHRMYAEELRGALSPPQILTDKCCAVIDGG